MNRISIRTGLILLIYSFRLYPATDSTSIAEILEGRTAQEKLHVLDTLIKNNRYTRPGYGHEGAKQMNALLQSEPVDSANFMRAVYCAKVFRDNGQFFESKSALGRIESFVPVLNSAYNTWEFYNTYGALYRYMGKLDLSVESYMKCIRISEETKDKEWLAISYNNIAGTYMALNRNEDALDYFLKAHQLYTELKMMSRLALMADNIGGVYQKLNMYDKALEYHLLANQIMSKETNTPRELGSNCNNIGMVLSAKELYSEARAYFSKALEISKLYNDWQNLSLVYLNMSDLELKLSNYRECIRLAKIAETYVLDSLQSTMGLEEVYVNQMRAYVLLGKSDSALLYFDKYDAAQDSLYFQEMAARVAESETVYNMEKKESLIMLLEKDQARKKLIIYAGSGGVLLLLLLVSVVARTNRQRKKTNKLLEAKNREIGEKNKDILDSIAYAKRIQVAMQPSLKKMKDAFPESFVYYRPRDIVSGDFYWFAEANGLFYIAAADCTGHGVPGALMSMVGLNFLDQLVKEHRLTDPSVILGELHRKVVRSLNQDSEQRAFMDGMDIALLCIDRQERKARFSGAVRPLVYSENGRQVVLKGDRYSIGGIKDLETPFTCHHVPCTPGIQYYLFSDGFADQFSGASGKKYMVKRFYTLLGSALSLPVQEQEGLLHAEFTAWKADAQQTDDVLVIGVRI